MTKAPAAPPHRIAFVITELDVGGAERCLTNLVLRIDKSRFRPTVFSLGPPPKRSDLVDQLSSAGITPTFLNATSVMHAWPALRSLRKQLQQLAPDLVQTFLYHANVLGTRAAKSAGVPHIVHGVRVADPSGWRQRVEKLSARNVDGIVCVSQGVATFLEHAGYARQKLTVIPNGIDLVKYRRRDEELGMSRNANTERAWERGTAGRPTPTRHIITVARLHEQKGLEWFLGALPRVFEQFPDVDLWLVGTGPAETQLKSLVDQLGLSTKVHFLGWRADVPGLLQASELFVLPSRWEGMSNALLEAMASALPVLSTRSEGSEELLGPGGCPQLLVFGDSDDLVAKIGAILRSPQQAKELGANNRHRAATFSLERMVSDYEGLYAKILGDS